MRGRVLFRHSQLSKAQRQGWSEARRQRRQSGTGAPARAARGRGGFLALCFSCVPEPRGNCLEVGGQTSLYSRLTHPPAEISRGEVPVASVAQRGTPPCCSGSENAAGGRKADRKMAETGQLLWSSREAGA